jgi:hypothetical protein
MRSGRGTCRSAPAQLLAPPLCSPSRMARSPTMNCGSALSAPCACTGPGQSLVGARLWCWRWQRWLVLVLVLAGLRGALPPSCQLV